MRFIQFFEFVINNFGIADIYERVTFDGPLNAGNFILRKRQVSSSEEPMVTTIIRKLKILRNYSNHNGFLTDGTAQNSRQRVIPISTIIGSTLNLEQSNPQVISFSVKGEYRANFNIKFTSEGQARHFVMYKVTRQFYFHLSPGYASQHS